MSPNDNQFFFGRAYDLKTKQANPEQPVYYDPADLTTHGVITGMTGSGKTGTGYYFIGGSSTARDPGNHDRPKRRPDQSPAAFP